MCCLCSLVAVKNNCYSYNYGTDCVGYPSGPSPLLGHGFRGFRDFSEALLVRLVSAKCR